MPLPLIKTWIALAPLYTVGFIEDVPKNKIDGSVSSIELSKVYKYFNFNVGSSLSFIFITYFIISLSSIYRIYSSSGSKSLIVTTCELSIPDFGIGYKLCIIPAYEII